MHELGGIRTQRPLRPAGLSHVGLFYDDLAETAEFYRDVLGLPISDIGGHAYKGGAAAPNLLFVRAGPEHHCVSLFPKEMKLPGDDGSMQHAAWEMHTYAELSNAAKFLASEGFRLEYLGRRAAGGNCAIYFLDPERNRVELMYDLDIVGWQGVPKPVELWPQFLVDGRLPKAPIKSTEDIIEESRVRLRYFGSGACTYTAERAEELFPRRVAERSYDASGERRARPFKVSRLRYYALSCTNLEREAAFYEDTMGLKRLAKGEKGELLFSVRPGRDIQLKLFARRKSTQGRTEKICFEVRSYTELLDASDYLGRLGISIEHRGRGESPASHNELCLDFSDPSGNPLRLSFSPDAHGFAETARSLKRPASEDGLPDQIECD